MKIKDILDFEESQTFERKSINIDAKTLAIPIIAFANADGGTVAIGITDRYRKIEGVDGNISKLNNLLRVPFDFCEPTVKVIVEKIPCEDSFGNSNHIILMHVEASTMVHANQSDEVYMRIGDKSKKLTFDERTQLLYDKGERSFEDKPVLDAEIDDLNLNFVNEYIGKIGYTKTAMEFLKENKGYVREKNGKFLISTAAILLFSDKPQTYFPRARIRFIKYEGVEEKFGSEMNVIKDVIFEGNILKMVQDSIAYLDTQIKEKTYLNRDGLFVTKDEYPKFVRQEIIVNAVTHRSYGIVGTEIQIKMFDDKIIVESPGKFPGLVRKDNIRYTHFSRNPKIAEYLKVYNFVKEYGEGVDRMYKELNKAGLREPEYLIDAFLLKTIIYNTEILEKSQHEEKLAIDNEKLAIDNEKLAIDNEKLAIGNEKLAIGNEKLAIGNEKIALDILKMMLNDKKYNLSTINNIFKIYNSMDTNQIFGTKDIEKIINRPTSTARYLMLKLKNSGVVVEVKGRGKGKYRFLKENELK